MYAFPRNLFSTFATASAHSRRPEPCEKIPSDRNALAQTTADPDRNNDEWQTTAYRFGSLYRDYSAAAPWYNLNPYSIIQRIILSGRILRLPVSGGLDLFQFENGHCSQRPLFHSETVLTVALWWRRGVVMGPNNGTHWGSNGFRIFLCSTSTQRYSFQIPNNVKSRKFLLG